MKTLRNPQPYGEQTTGPLKRNDVFIVALDLRLLNLYKLVTSLKQTAGGDQRFAHIRNLPRGVHIASSACLDSKTPLPIVLDVGPIAPFKPTPLCDMEVASSGYSVHTDLGSTLSTAPESTNASNSFQPRVPSFRSVTELMVVVGSSPQSRQNRSLSASVDGSVPTSSTSWQSSADGQSLAGWSFPPHL